MGRCEASLRNPFMGFRPAGLVYRLDLLAKGMEGLMGTAVPVLAKSTFLAQEVFHLARASCFHFWCNGSFLFAEPRFVFLHLEAGF